MKTCPGCGNQMPELTQHGNPRKYCTQGCAARHTRARQKKRDMYADEVEHLTSLGMSPHAIAKALDTTPSNLARALYREGRNDLAHPFERAAWAARNYSRSAA